MPIYAYRCEACGFDKDVLQKISDPQLTVCPSCDAPSFKKQLTAAGFQLKGTGWYATDFRNGNSAKPKEAEGNKTAEAGSDDKVAAPTASDAAKASDKSANDAATPSSGSTASSTTTAPAPAAAAGKTSPSTGA
jgi:putative FmdB family regulatory protein